MNKGAPYSVNINESCGNGKTLLHISCLEVHTLFGESNTSFIHAASYSNLSELVSGDGGGK
jgi:hypothetical protein